MVMKIPLWGRLCCVAAFLCLSANVACQGIDDDCLNSAVFIKRTVAGHPVTGSGFLVVRIVSNDLKTFQVVLVTNKHVLPHEGDENGTINLKIAIRNGQAIETKEISVDILGGDKKYTGHVAMHPDPKVDVAAVIITNELRNENTDYLNRILE